MQTWTNAHSLPEIGAFIRATRQAQQLTQQEFSEDLGVSRATLSALENGRAGSSDRAPFYVPLAVRVVRV